jgi:hypothetical protein
MKRSLFPVVPAVVCSLILGSLQLLAPSRAGACSCLQDDNPPSLDAVIDTADAVFLGRVIGQSEIEGGRAFLFEVQSSWQGVDQPEVTIYTGTGGGDCGYDFEEGERYLVYAGKAPNGYGTNICTRTARVVGDDVPLDVYNAANKYESGKYGLVVTESDLRTLRPAKWFSKQVSDDTEVSLTAEAGRWIVPVISVLLLGIGAVLLLKRRTATRYD